MKKKTYEAVIGSFSVRVLQTFGDEESLRERLRVHLLFIHVCFFSSTSSLAIVGVRTASAYDNAKILLHPRTFRVVSTI